MIPNKPYILILVWIITFIPLIGEAKDVSYRGKVEGMACAFCAYNMSKTISAISGVVGQSVNIDLKTGEIDFAATSPIDKTKISARIADSGFKLIQLEQISLPERASVKVSSEPIFAMSFTASNINQLDSILEAIGKLAASKASQLSITAPQAAEIEILKLVLVGRQNAINIQFFPVKNKVAQIKLFLNEPAE